MGGARAPGVARAAPAYPRPMAATPPGSSLPLIPIYPRVVRPPADGDDVRLAVPVQVGDRQVLDRHPTVIDDVPGPLLAHAVGGLVDADAALLGKRVPLGRVV